MQTFIDLGLSEKTLKAISDLGFERPTEIQSHAIPQLLHGDSDFIGMAQTGTGKTGAFGLPLIERIQPDKRFTQALILAPTRELGQQICQQLAAFSKYHKGVYVMAVYGGAAIGGQLKALKKAQHIIVATPGRLRDLMRRKAVKLDQLEYLILDEADEMMRMGFREEIDEILLSIPKEKLTWLFSATMPADIRRIVKTYMSDPIEIAINEEQRINTDIEHQFVSLRQSEKLENLTRLLDMDPKIRGLVFCRTKLTTQNLSDELVKRGYAVDALHGDLSQRQRDRVMAKLKKKEVRCLIATDVAARGIDVDDLTHVFHYNLPHDAQQYTHRSGRTARAGKKGISLALVSDRDRHKLKSFTKSLGIVFTRFKVPTRPELAGHRIEAWCNRIANRASGGKVEKKLLDQAKYLFWDLSKDELIEEILKDQLRGFNVPESSGSSKASFPPKKSHKKKSHSGNFSKFHKSSKTKKKGDRKKRRFN